MRIGIVTQSYHPVLGGVTEHVQGLAISLLRRGHEIAVITGKSGAALSSEEMRLRRAGGEIVRVGQPYRVRCNGASVTIVGEPGLSSGLRAIPRNRFDVVHIHSPLEPFLPTAAAFWFDAPLVGTFHSAGRRGRGYRVFRPLLAPVVQRLAVRTAVSASAREYVESVFPGRYRSVPNGIELDRFARPAQGRKRAQGDEHGLTLERVNPTQRTGPHAAMHMSEHAPMHQVPFGRKLRLLMVGRLDARKGHDVVLEALTRSATSSAALHLDIVGDGSLRSRLSERSRRLPVTLHGSLSAAATAELYRNADIFLAPAQYGESFGVVLLEAMAAGCPLIASDIAGYRDVLKGSGAGILVAPDDPDAWTAAIHDLAWQPERRSAMGRCGELHAARFSWDLIAGEMERVYGDALGGTLTEFSERSFARRSAPLPDEMPAITPRG